MTTLEKFRQEWLERVSEIRALAELDASRHAVTGVDEAGEVVEGGEGRTCRGAEGQVDGGFVGQAADSAPTSILQGNQRQNFKVHLPAIIRWPLQEFYAWNFRIAWAHHPLRRMRRRFWSRRVCG